MGSKLIAASLTGGFICVIMLLVLRPIAVSLKLIDRPGGRKRHVGHIPIIGGLGMFVGFLVGSVLAMPNVSTLFLLASSGFLVFVGVIDDRYDLPPTVRLGTQVGTVLVMVFGVDLTIVTLGNPFGTGELLTGPLSLVVTVIAVVAVVNAINMTDGMDGLAGSLSLVALTGLTIGAWGTSVMASSVIGATVVLAFLGFNFPVKVNRSIRTFMGDAGSTFLGFVIAWGCVAATQPPNSLISPAAALGLVAVPLYDLVSCFFRRILDGRSPMSADRNHFHHVLQEAGLKRRQILVCLVGLAASIAAVCLILDRAGMSDLGLFAVWCILGVGTDLSLRGLRSLKQRTLVKKTL